MDHKAALLALVLVSSSLAGCTGDPGDGGGDEFDSEALQDLIDENLQDFMNNTSITVNNHYHNNTTVVNNDYNTNNDYNNTTNVDGGEINNYNQYNGSGDGSGSVVQAFRIIWNPDERHEPTDFGSRDLVINGIVQVPGWAGSEMSYQYNGQLIKLSFTCEEFVNAYEQMEGEDWEEWVFGEYGGSQSQADNLGYSIRQDVSEVNSGARDYCWTGGSSAPTNYYDDYMQDYDTERHYTTVLEIPLSAGQAIDFMSLPILHNVTLECDDGYGSSSSNGSQSNYPLLGGHEDCTVRANARIDTAYTYQRTAVSNGSGPSIQTPDWFNGGQWYVFTNVDAEWWNYTSPDYPRVYTPTDFLVYFTMHFVQVYEHDLE